MKTIKAAFAALVMITGSTSAMAADLPGSTKDTYQTQTSPLTITERGNFAGAFVGASVNWDRLDVKHSGSVDWSECESPCLRNALDNYFGTEGGIAGNLPDMDDDGISGGVRAGWMFQVGRIYGGPVVMFDYGQVEASMAHDFVFDDQVVATGNLSVSSDWRAAAVGKLGFEVTSWLGVYGIAGVGVVDLSVDGSLSGPAAAELGAAGSVGANDTVTAFTYGVGADVRFSQDWKLFAEWQRFDLDSFENSAAIDCFRFSHDADADLDVIRVGLTYTFN